MIRRKIFVFVLLLGILVLTTDAFALPVGQHFGFYDVMLPGTTNTWTHSLDNIVNFIPDLNGTEPNLIIKHALLLISLNFKPQYNPTIGKYVFIASVELDDKFLGSIDYRFNNNLVRKRLWGKSIIDIDILDKIADKSAKIEIITSPGWGKLKSVNHSVLLGSGVVGPEPISMALVGAGLAGLPIAVRFRRLLRK